MSETNRIMPEYLFLNQHIQKVEGVVFVAEALHIVILEDFQELFTVVDTQFVIDVADVIFYSW